MKLLSARESISSIFVIIGTIAATASSNVLGIQNSFVVCGGVAGVFLVLAVLILSITGAAKVAQ